MKKKVFIIGSMMIFVVIILALVIGGMQRKPQGSIQGPEDVVPSYEVLAQNGTFVYCVSDKKTFKKSGFTSLANYGQQILR